MRWTLKPKPDPQKVKGLSQALGVPMTIAYLLVQRDVVTFEQARNYFRPNLQKLHDPFLMKDMNRAVQRIEKALNEGENILVYGDYDVDGTTSVALMTSFLKTFSNQIQYYIPDRYTEGYGISKKGIDFADRNNVGLIIALDCGIKAVKQVKYAAQKEIDFIICDHHRPGKAIPEAVAVLDPKREDCKYPYKELCGCGLGFKLIQAMAQKKEIAFSMLHPYLDLVATAIGADIVPITGENRILAYHGLKVLNEAPRFGFKTMITPLQKETLSITDVVFIIAPRINAAGRMKHAGRAAELLMAEKEEQALKIAGEIETYNKDRKIADRRITQEALEQIARNGEQNRFTTVVFQEDWHKGVIGIVASRLTETYYRPTLVFTKNDGELSASARSVYGFDIYEALEDCADCIEQFGGHKYAAGLTLKEENYEAFKQKFEAVVAKRIDKKLLEPQIRIDRELEFKEVTPKFYRILKQFAPFGPGNMRPVFLSRNLTDTGYAKLLGEDNKHLRCAIRQNGYSGFFGAIGFNLGEKLTAIASGQKFEAAYVIDENVWKEKVSLQLKLRDLR